MLALIPRLSKENRLVIIVTHDASITSLSDKTLYIHDGEVIKKDNCLAKEKAIL